jgi:hypothetical protein
LKKGVYDPSFAPFSVDGAKALVDLGVKLVGLDYLSNPRLRTAGVSPGVKASEGWWSCGGAGLWL